MNKSKKNENNFYQRNKIIIWVLVFLIIGIIMYFVINRNNNDTEKPLPKNVVVSLSPKSDVTVGVGYSTYLFAMVDGNPNAVFSWKSSDPSIATVLNGNVVGIKNGKTTISATYSENGKDYTVTKDITVINGKSNIELMDISLPNGELYMPIGSEYKLNLNLTPSNARVDKVIFKEGDPNIVDVSESGLVKAKKNGHTIINVEVNNKFKKSIDVYVGNYTDAKIIISPDIIILNTNSVKLKVGGTIKLNYTVMPNNIDKSFLSWSSSDEKIVTVNKEGIITAKSLGKAIVSITSLNGKRDDVIVEVSENIIEIKDIVLTKEVIDMKAGETDNIIPQILPDNASSKYLSFTSSNSDILSVSINSDKKSATISALKEGNAVITITGGKIEKKVTVNVTGKTNNNSQDEESDNTLKTIKVRSDKNNLAKNLEDAKKIGVAGISTVSVVLRDGVYKVKYCLNKIDASSPCVPIIDMYTSFPVTIPSGNIYVLRIKKYDSNNNEISSTSPNYVDGVLNYYINTSEKEDIKTKQYEITGAYFNTTYSKAYPLNLNESVNIKLLDNKRHLLMCYTTGTSCTPNIKITNSYRMKLDKTGTWRIIVDEYDINNNKLGDIEVYYAYVK